jgi:mannose-6-phosphate isomerase-like protein (cupin superfamily)
MKLFLLVALAVSPALAKGPLAQRIGHTDPSKYVNVSGPGTHLGAGHFLITALLDADIFHTNLVLYHRGVVPPKCGIGNHLQYGLEDCFVIFDNEAQFTVNGRTARLEGPVAVPATLRGSHALYNPTDQPTEWMNIAVSTVKGMPGDIVNLDDDRANAPLDPKPVFMFAPLRRNLLRPVEHMNGGKGTVQYRRALTSEMFLTNWAYLDHMLLPPGASVGRHKHMGLEEVFYVMSGQGSVTVNGESADIRKGDAVPVLLQEVHSFQNTGAQDLELLVVGISLEKGKLDSIDVPEGAGGG